MQVNKRVEKKSEDYVLDYGCGPGSYITPISELVGKDGKIYALDINPLAIQRVQRIASTKQLTNLEPICSDCKTGIMATSHNTA